MLLDDHRSAEAQWFHHMRRGDFESAWRISDRILTSRRVVPTSPTRPAPVWTGAPIDGRAVLIRCHHGLGDTLQFIRYAPLVRARASRVIAVPQPELISILDRVAGIDHVAHASPSEDAYEIDIEVMELPYVFRTTLATIPSVIPYIHIEPERGRRHGKMAIGLVWRAGEWQPQRSIDVRLLAPLGSIPGVILHILQQGAARDDLPQPCVESSRDDVLDLARVIRSLDLVIGVDTMVGHLAGALGVPVWMLLREEADWRWLQGRDDSPWYPTMRLFRQEREGDWRTVAERVVSAVRHLVETG